MDTVFGHGGYLGTYGFTDTHREFKRQFKFRTHCAQHCRHTFKRPGTALRFQRDFFIDPAFQRPTP